ncbi:MAG: protein kinase [Shewanella sp.]
MHTLEQLRTGLLNGATDIRIHEQLTEFPVEIFKLADSLQLLDLSQNQLSTLPAEFACLTELKILFMSDNLFDHLPDVLGQCPKLEMIGFKSNQIKTVSESSIPPQCRWLILTNNRINKLPQSLGSCRRLQKLALAGNQITHLPASMSQCTELQLARLSANQLTEIPEFLLNLPKLSWLALAGNPCTQTDAVNSVLPEVEHSVLRLGHVLGQGASGVIYQGVWQQQDNSMDVAIKLFKGEVTSDGYPSDELAACIQAGEHPNLISTLASIKANNQAEQEGEQAGVILRLVPANYYNLGLPPSLVTCTRDTFAPDIKLSQKQVRHLIRQAVDVINHLHQQGLTHGDIYAHNMLINQDHELMLGDMGAATPLARFSNEHAAAMQAIEVRALGCVIDDLLSVCNDSDTELLAIRDACWQVPLRARPSLSELVKQLALLD